MVFLFFTWTVVIIVFVDFGEPVFTCLLSTYKLTLICRISYFGVPFYLWMFKLPEFVIITVNIVELVFLVNLICKMFGNIKKLFCQGSFCLWNKNNSMCQLFLRDFWLREHILGLSINKVMFFNVFFLHLTNVIFLKEHLILM